MVPVALRVREESSQSMEAGHDPSEPSRAGPGQPSWLPHSPKNGWGSDTHINTPPPQIAGAPSPPWQLGKEMGKGVWAWGPRFGNKEIRKRDPKSEYISPIFSQSPAKK